MDCSTPCFPVHHQLLKLAQTHVYQVEQWNKNKIEPIYFSQIFSPLTKGYYLINNYYSFVHILVWVYVWVGFPDSSVGKESACNGGNRSWIPGLGRSPGEGIDYPLQYSWVSLVAQMVKNLTAMQKTWVRSLVWEDALEEGMATHSSILAWRIPMDRGACPVHRVPKCWTQLSD